MAPTRFDIKPGRIIDDTAYGSASMLAWMVDEIDIEPHVPLWEKTHRQSELRIRASHRD